MRGFGRAVGAVAFVASLGLAGAGANAAQARVTKVRNEALTATGSLTYTWSGDPARGCAAAGVCGIHGELILRPQPSGAIVTPVGSPITVFLGQSGAVRVVREEVGVTVGQCVDVPGNSFELLTVNPSARRATTASILSPPSSGRCAGPTSADLAGVPIAVRRTGGGSFDLTGTRPFAAGPFSGTLVSTMRLLRASRPPPGEGFSSSSSGPGRPGHPAQAPLRELIQLQYRVSPGPGAIQTQFSGAGDPSCQIVDSCGTSGSLAFSLGASRGITVIGSRLVARRLTRGQVLADARRGKVALNVLGLVTGQVSETLSWPGGSSCHDAVTTPSSAGVPTLLLNAGTPFRPPTAGRTIPVTVSANGSPSAEVFRTHCPGPDDADLFGVAPNGQPQIYARGSITTAQLLGRRSVLTLSDSGSFSGLGYAGRRAGSISLDLTLTKITAQTTR